MKNYLKSTLFILSLALIASCSPKDKELVPADQVNITPGGTPGTPGAATFDPSTQTLVLQGTFKDAVHPTSGTAKLYQKGTTYTLVFENFKSDAGPDLRIYLAEDNQAKNFIQLAELKNTGNFFLTLPDNAGIDKRKSLLIWCKQFAVLFGSAQLADPTQK